MSDAEPANTTGRRMEHDPKASWLQEVKQDPLQIWEGEGGTTGPVPATDCADLTTATRPDEVRQVTKSMAR